MSAVTVVCIKWGDKYPAAYVNRLHAGVRRFLSRPFRFVCFTERAEGIEAGIEVQPLPVEPYEAALTRLTTGVKRAHAYRKISLFRPGLAGISGPTLGFDIDTVITGRLDDLFDFAPGKVCMARDWLRRRRGRPGGHGSVFLYDPSRHGFLYEEFARDPEGSAARYGGGEQRYTSMTAQAHGELVYWPSRWIVSFKRHAIPFPPLNYLIEPRLPAGARVVCFHGTPKMDEALAGHRGSWRRTTRPATWLRDYWLQEPARAPLAEGADGGNARARSQ